MREADLEIRMKKMRAEYDQTVGEIVWLVERRKKVRKQLRRKEDWLRIRLMRLKNKLANLNPLKWRFGAKINKTNKKVSIYTDNGFYVCQDCQQLFKPDSEAGHVESFRHCSEHLCLKPVGRIEQTHDFDWEHRSPQFVQNLKRRHALDGI